MRQPLPGGLRGGGFGARPLCVKQGGRKTGAAVPTGIGFIAPDLTSTEDIMGTESGAPHSTRGGFLMS